MRCLREALDEPARSDTRRWPQQPVRRSVTHHPRYVDRGEVAGLVMLLSCRDEAHVESFGVMDLESREAMRRDTIFRIASLTKPITAVAAMMLVEDGKLALDEPVDRLLPELANRKVFRHVDGPLDNTVPADRPTTVRDLLTFRGFGLVLEQAASLPVQKAMVDAGVGIGPRDDSRHTPDEWIAALGRLQLMYQPGERWLYHTGSEILGVLIARAAGKPLGDVLRERILEPLGMRDTGFSVPDSDLDRLPTAYQPDAATGELRVYDRARGGRWSRPPIFPSGGAGLVSTVDDYLAFGRMQHLANPLVSRLHADFWEQV